MDERFQAGLVSVIIPTYNRAHLIRETLESVRAQTCRPIEVIVVDDGSTDSTEEAVRKFAESATDLQVSYVRQDNRGAPAARNRGLAESGGEFIQFLDSDDLIRPSKLAEQVRAMRGGPDIQYVFSAWEMFEEGSTPPQVWRKGFRPDLSNVLDLMLGKDPRQLLPLHTANGLYRRSLCLRLGPWDTGLKCLQPRLYNLPILLLGVPCHYLPAVHLRARQHPGDQISDHYVEPEYLTDRVETWRKIRTLILEAGMMTPRRGGLMGGVYYGLARDAFRGGAGRMGMDFLREGAAIAPLSWAWLKLRVTGLLYRALGARLANRLFARAAAARTKAARPDKIHK